MAAENQVLSTIPSIRRPSGFLLKSAVFGRGAYPCGSVSFIRCHDGLAPVRELMKAVVCHEYGSPDVLKYEEIEKPTPGNEEVLIKVRAASLNPLDGGSMKGRPYAIRLMTGLRRPKNNRPGVDLAGQVEAIGSRVTQFKPGDEVFGVCISDPKASGTEVWTHRQGSFAEYVCAPEATLAPKPSNVSFEQAASVPVAALTALQGLRDKGQIQSGQKVVINGAAGGVGTL